MDIRNIITFVHVAEMGSFTKAANFLGYSQSTVSFQIKQLETEFGCQLFERINHSVSLTDKGRELLEYAHRINKLTDEMHEAMTQDHQVSGSVRIATADSLCAWLMRERFMSFRQAYPGITLKLIPAGTEEMFRMMDCNEVDAVMTLDSHIYNSEYMLAKEEKAAAVFVTSPQLEERIRRESKERREDQGGGEAASDAGAQGAASEAKAQEATTQVTYSIHELLAYPFLLTEKGMSYRRLLDDKLAAQSLEIRPVLETGNADLIADLVEQGAGIAVLPDFMVKDRIAEGRLVSLTVEGMEIEIWKQMIYHRRKWLSKPLDCVIRHFCQ